MWARIDDRFFSHPKHLRAGLAGNGLFVRALAYCAGHMTDGFVPEEFVRGQLSTVHERKLPARLVECGLWEEVDGGYRVHDFLAYNMSREQWERRQAAGKKGAEARWAAKGNANRIAEPEPEPDPERPAARGEGL